MQALSLGLSTAATGMLVVFFGLAVLILCIYAMTSITGNKKPAAPKKEEAPAPAAPVQAEEVYVQNDDALIAVISAAIAAMLSSETGAEQPASGFVVRRVKRIQTAPAWQKGAREEQMYGRM
ncbi:MAG: hypothetical protein E7326_07195 [Clostridiales bacterium]|nr:hypothetical protein [Clostridiales bacterium]